MKRIIIGLGLIAGSLYMYASPGYATQEQHHPVTICHRTNSNTNPYIQITVDDDAVDSQGISDHQHHEGPVWNPTLKNQKIKWGDIIPPRSDDDAIDITPKNWVDGQAIWNNGCDIPCPEIVAQGENECEPPTTTTTIPSTTTTTTEAPTTTTTVAGIVPTNPETPVAAQGQPELAMTGISWILALVGGYLVLSGWLAMGIGRRLKRMNG